MAPSARSLLLPFKHADVRLTLAYYVYLVMVKVSESEEISICCV